MELRDFVHIFIRRKELLIVLTVAGVLVGLLVYRLQGETYHGEVLLSVTRTAVQVDTPDYRYDQFYRLQADERMAETIARYLESKSGKKAVASAAKLNTSEETRFLDEKVKALRLSSNLIQVTYGAASIPAGEHIADALLGVANRYVDALNQEAREREWFAMIAEPTILRDARLPLHWLLLAGFLGGVFIAFWAVLGQHYFFRKPTTDDQQPTTKND